MEPRGCNRWQPFANWDRQGSREKKQKTVAVGCDPWPERSAW